MLIRLVFLSMFAFICGCQSLPLSKEQKNISSSFLVNANLDSSDMLYDGVKDWLKLNDKESESLFSLENDGIFSLYDPKKKKLIGSGSIEYPCNELICFDKEDWSVKYDIIIEVINQKEFKIKFTNLYLYEPAVYYAGVYHKSRKSSLSDMSDYNNIRPILLKYGLKIKDHIEQIKRK